MRDRTSILSYALILAILLFSLFIGSDVSADVIPEVFEIEGEDHTISVHPASDSSIIINATVNSPFRESTSFTISAQIRGSSDWSLDHPDSLLLDYREQITFRIKITAPVGEDAGKRVTLDMELEAVDGMGMWSDSCSITVLPYVWASLAPETEYQLDMPLSGEFNLTLKNEGNTQSIIGYSIQDRGDPVMRMLDTSLDVDEEVTISIPFDAEDVEDTIEMTVEPIGRDGAGQSVEIVIIRDRDLVHILFRRGPILVILPGPVLQGEDTIRFRSIGGEVENVVIEIDDPAEDLVVRMDSIAVIDNLARIDMEVKIDGSDEDRVVLIRAAGYHDGSPVESNVIPFNVKARSEGSSGLNAAMVMQGTAIGGAGLAVGFSAYLYAASEVFRYRWLTLFLIPLYAVVKKDKVLDHFFRGRLYEYIKENPGITYTALKKHFDVNNGTLTYHLHRLEKEELIDHRNVGKYKLFYPDGVRMRGTEIVISLLDQDILEFISTDPGISASEVIDRLRGERSKRTLSRHIKDLERKGLIEIRREGDRRKIYLSEGWDNVILSSRGVTNMRDEVTADA